MPKLVNLGSLCIDNVYRVANIAVAGESAASTSHDVFPGGKGLNQSIAAARGGAEVVHVGAVGEDGAWLRETLVAHGVDASGVRVVDGSSGHAVIQVDDAGRNAIVVVGGANRQLHQDDVQRALEQVHAGDWLLLQNEINDLEAVLRQAKERGCRTAFNVAPRGTAGKLATTCATWRCSSSTKWKRRPSPASPSRTRQSKRCGRAFQ